MRIGHVTVFYPPRIGGMERCVYELAKEQAEHKNEVTVFTSMQKTLNHEPNSNPKILQIKTLRIKETLIPTDLISQLSRCELDILHIHISFPFFPEITAIVSKIRKIPFVTHVHLDPDYRTPFFPVYWSYLYISTCFVVTLSDAVIVPTENYKRLIEYKYKKFENLFVVPYGVDLLNFTSSKYEKTAAKTILYVGRINPQKGLDRLILAMKRVVVEIPTIKLIIVGSAETANERKFEESLKKHIYESAFSNHISFKGAVDHSVLPKFYSEASVFVAPSRFESFGIVLMEAMASGIPIVASDIPEFREVAGNAALLVDFTSNEEQLASAIIKVIRDKNLQEKMIYEGTEKAKEYTWKSANKKISIIYNYCTGQK